MGKPVFKLTARGLQKFVEALEKKGANFFTRNPKTTDNINFSALEKAAKAAGLGTSTETFEKIFQKNRDRGHNEYNNEGTLVTIARWLGIVLEPRDFSQITATAKAPNNSSSDKAKQKEERDITATGESILDSSIAMPPIAETCPYVGLNAFDEMTAQWYFGREKSFERLLGKIEQNPFVFVVGVSGSGKSSLVKAKLIPEMKSRNYRVVLMKPGTSPIQKLKFALTEELEGTDADVVEIEERIDRDGLLAAIAYLPMRPILLVIDQFEEIFAICQSQTERHKFIQMLVDIAKANTPDFAIAATMRVDFLAECSHANLEAIVNEQMVMISGMSDAELRDAIAKPAETQGYQISEGLLDAILRDIEAEPSCLPLLEFTLQELWESRDRQKRLLTLDGYREMDRLKGALNRHANLRYAEQSENGRKWMRQIFLKLVRTGIDTKDTRQRERRQELLNLAGEDAIAQKEIEKVLSCLEGKRGRLLVASEENGVAIVDLAHEALMDGWQMFKDWRSQDRDLRRLRDRIADDFNQWNHTKHKDIFLLSESLVVQIQDAIDIDSYLTPEQQKYKQLSLFKYYPYLNPDNFPEMVDIPSGTFWMGSPDGKGNNDEKPYHQVTVPTFRMSKYPVTQAQWYAVAKSSMVDGDLNPTPSFHRGETLPVEQVSWSDAREFCKRLSKLTGETYRLPSEAEWEYACRAGANDYTEYCFGDEASQLDKYAWYGNNSGKPGFDADRAWQKADKDANKYWQRLRDNQNRTHPIGEKQPNAWGLYDMHGNVWEWCEDDWHGDYNGAPDDASAWIDNDRTDSSYRLLRGSSWLNSSYDCRSAIRSRNNADVRNYILGFRVVVSVFASL
jgi:formylglycine-generating enzyme required for sulfatase activity/energy-coupling factor transporter ATP-binding protein EcfA2